MVDNKRIAKNTIFLYFRMFVVMGVSLYTSRVVLDKLGVDDYALFNVVGGVVTMLTFLNTCLGTGTSRFIMFDMGHDNNLKLRTTFNTAFYSHMLIGVFLVVVLETVGLYFVINKLVIPENRFDAALIVYHISIVTMLIGILKTPYTAAILAHERMEIYAYISLFEAFGKLMVVYLLCKSDIDKLILYACLTAVLNIIVTFLYIVYCRANFPETKLGVFFDKDTFKSIVSFSGWNLIAQMSESLKGQGIIILMNMFLTPVVVAAQSIANQIGSALTQFLYNFRSAINPQVVKLYAAGKKEESKQLTLRMFPYVFDLSLLICFPLILLMKPILSIWLVEVPDFAVVFCQFMAIQRIVDNIGGHLHTQLTASGNVKQNSMAALFLGVGQFVLLYFILRCGGGPMWIQYCALFATCTFAFVVKPIILIKYENYSAKDLYPIFLKCFYILILSSIFPIMMLFLLESDTWIYVIVVGLTSIVSVIVVSILTMNVYDRMRLWSLLKKVIVKR